mgnify:CR=1 FL=1
MFSSLSIFMIIAPALAGSPESETIYHAAPGQAFEDKIVLSAESMLSISTFEDIGYWEFDLNITNVKAVTVNVKASQDWTLAASDTDLLTKGHMTKYNLSTGKYDPTVKLVNPMIISGSSGDGEVELPDGGVICTGGPTDEAGQDVEITLKQPISRKDLRLLGANQTYRLTVNFSGQLIE